MPKFHPFDEEVQDAVIIAKVRGKIGPVMSAPPNKLVEWGLAVLIMLFFAGILAVFVAFLRGSQL